MTLTDAAGQALRKNWIAQAGFDLLVRKHGLDHRAQFDPRRGRLAHLSFIPEHLNLSRHNLRPH